MEVETNTRMQFERVLGVDEDTARAVFSHLTSYETFENAKLDYLSMYAHRRQVQGLRGKHKKLASPSKGTHASSFRYGLSIRQHLRNCVDPMRVARLASARTSIQSCPKCSGKRPGTRRVRCSSSTRSRLSFYRVSVFHVVTEGAKEKKFFVFTE